MSTFDAVQDPDANLDYKINWALWLNQDTITASTYTIDPAGALTITFENYDTTETEVWLSNGDRGRKYKVINHITTAQGRETDRTILVEIQDK